MKSLDFLKQAQKLLDEGKTIREVCKILKCSPNTLIKYSIRPPEVKFKYTRTNPEAIVELINKGKTKAQIMKELKCNHKAIVDSTPESHVWPTRKEKESHINLKHLKFVEEYEFGNDNIQRMNSPYWNWIDEWKKQIPLKFPKEMFEDNSHLFNAIITRKIEKLNEKWYNRANEIYNKEYTIEEDEFSEEACNLKINFWFWSMNVKGVKINGKTLRKHKEIYIPALAKRNCPFLYKNLIFRCMTAKLSYSSNEKADQVFRFAKYQKFQPITHASLIKQAKQQILVTYDVETCEFATGDEMYDCSQQVYMLCAHVDYNLPYIAYSEHKTFLQEDLTEPSMVADNFVNWLHNKMKKYFHWDDGEDFNGKMRKAKATIRIIGFNNFHYDDNFIEPALKKLNGSFTSVNERNLHTGTVKWYIDFLRYETYDLIKWIPDMTLLQACDDYDLKERKIDYVDIVKYNKKSTQLKQLFKFCSDNEFYEMLKTKPNFAQKRELKIKYYDNEMKMFNILKMIEEYCYYDTYVVALLYRKIHNALTDIGLAFANENINLKSLNFADYPSPANYAMNIFKSLCAQEDMIQMIITDPSLGRFIYQSYFGGRVDYGFIGEYITEPGKLALWDVTSEYPLAMMSKYPLIKDAEDIKLGLNVDINYYQYLLDQCLKERNEARDNKTLHIFSYFKYLEDWKGIFMANLYPPEDKTNLLHFAAIPTRGEKKLKYTNVKQLGRVINTSQCKNLILSGFKIEIVPHQYNIVFTKVDYTMKKYVEIIGKMKYDSKQDENKTKAKLMKLFLNSIAGKLAQKPIDNLAQQESINFTETIYTLCMKYESEKWEKSFHYLATFITAEANFILYSSMYKLSLHFVYDKIPLSDRCGSILYMDTDSLAIDYNNVTLDYHTFNVSEELGYYDENKYDYYITWKEKYTKNAQIDKMFIIAKKSYAFVEGTLVKDIKLKGIHRESMELLSTYDKLRQLCKEKITINFEGLISSRARFKDMHLEKLKSSKVVIPIFSTIHNTEQNVLTRIFKNGTIKKSLEPANEGNEIKSTNLLVNNLNKDNINDGFLKFYCSKF